MLSPGPGAVNTRYTLTVTVPSSVSDSWQPIGPAEAEPEPRFRTSSPRLRFKPPTIHLKHSTWYRREKLFGLKTLFSEREGPDFSEEPKPVAFPTPLAPNWFLANFWYFC